MEIDCSNVECYDSSTRFGDCEDENLIPSAILLIVTSLAEFIHFGWACCLRDYKCYDEWSTPLDKRKYQILSMWVARLLVVVVESFWVVIFANYNVVEPDCSCKSTFYLNVYAAGIPYKKRVFFNAFRKSYFYFYESSNQSFR